MSLLLLTLHRGRVVVLNFRLRNLDDLLAIVELLLDNQRVNDFTRLARCERMLLPLWHYLLFLYHVGGLLLRNSVLDSTWDVVGVNYEVVDVDLNEARGRRIFLLCSLRRGHFFDIGTGSWGRLRRLDQISTDDDLSGGSRLLLIRLLMKQIIVIFLLHEQIRLLLRSFPDLHLGHWLLGVFAEDLGSFFVVIIRKDLLMLLL